MKIKHISIEHFRAIEHLDFDCSDGVNAFIGDNGAGKSTVLDVITILYSWLNAKLSSSKKKGRSIREDDISIGSQYCYLSIEVEHKGMTAQWSLFKSHTSDNSQKRRTDLKQLEFLVKHIRNYGEDKHCMLTVYGVNRNISSVTVNKQIYGKNKGLVVTASRNSVANVSWKPFFNWYYERENEENRMKARFNQQYHDESLDVIRECLVEVFPEYKNLRIEDRPTRFVIEKGGKDINFERLSDGEKCYITLVLDIARRLSMQNDRQGDILDGEQTFLIDELDLHLHPSWQLYVISNLVNKFPRCQFFVTSHSSLVLSSLREQDRLVILREGGQLELPDIPYGDNSDYILKRFYGLSFVRNPMVQAEIDSISSALSGEHPDLEEIERKLDSLNERGVQFEESVKMRLLLAQKKKKAHEKN